MMTLPSPLTTLSSGGYAHRHGYHHRPRQPHHSASESADITTLTVTGRTFTAAQGQPTGNQVVATFTDGDNNTSCTASIPPALTGWAMAAMRHANVTWDAGDGYFVVTGNNTFTSAGISNVVTIIDTVSGDSFATQATASVAGIIATAADPVAATQDTAPGNVTLATFTNALDPTNSGNYTASIDWLGNGTDVTGNATYSGNGTYTVTGNITASTYAAAGTFEPVVTITDTSAGNITATATGEVDVAGITVSADDPIYTTLANGNGSFTGNVATFTDAATDAPTDPGNSNGNYTAAINWGDGNTTAGNITWDSTNDDFVVAGNYTYTSAGTPTVTVTVTNTDGRSGNVTESANVSSLTTWAETISGVQGQTFTGNVATFTDANYASWHTGNDTADIDWGDGNDSPGTITSDWNGGFIVSGNDTFAMAGNLTVTVTITDSATGNSTATVTDSGNITGINATAADPVTATQDTALGNTVLATFTNTIPGSGNDIYTASIDWLGDGSTGSPQDGTEMGNATITSDGLGNYTVSGNITASTYAAAGSFYPVITITDTSAGNITATVDGEVDVAGISVTADPINASQFNGNVSGSGNFTGNVATFTDTAPDAPTDPGNNTGNYTATINWGDGSGNSTGTITYDSTNQDFVVAGNHTYTSAGTPTVTVTVTNTDGRSSVSSGTVANVPTLAVTGLTINGGQGQTFIGNVATFGDSNVGTSPSYYSADINWGDGNDSPGIINYSGNNTYTISGSNTFAAAGNLSITVTVFDTANNTSATGTATGNITGLVASAASAGNATEGQAISNVLLATFYNNAPGTSNDHYSASIDWFGDGSVVTTGNLTQSGGNWSVTGSLDAGNVTFGAMYPTITITDGNNTALNATVYGEVDVAAAALSVSGVSFTATAGTLFSGNVATFTSGDPYATADDFIARINWGDCSDTTYGIVTAVANSPGNYTVAGSYAYAGNGSYNVSVTITDVYTGNTATASPTATVTATPGIAPAQPALTAGNVTDSEIDLSYSESDNSHLELEEMAPGDVNFHFLADLGSGPVTNGSYEATGLTSAAGYDFRIRADQAGLVTYADAGMTYTKLPDGRSGPGD